MFKKWKYRVAEVLTDRTELCWSDLVSWSEGNRTFREINRMGECQKHDHIGYCGKCKQRGMKNGL